MTVREVDAGQDHRSGRVETAHRPDRENDSPSGRTNSCDRLVTAFSPAVLSPNAAEYAPMTTTDEADESLRETGAGMSIGLVLGVAIGAATNELAMGIALGLVLGAGVDAGWSRE